MDAGSRRSVRNHKTVNYAKLDAGSDDDDDFKPQGLNNKKQRKGKEVVRSPATVKQAVEVLAPLPDLQAPGISSQASPQRVQKRSSLDEKLFERDLKLALQLSQQEPCIIPVLGNEEKCRVPEVCTGDADDNSTGGSSESREKIPKKKERRKGEVDLDRPDEGNDERYHSPGASCFNNTADDSECYEEPKKKIPKIEDETSLPVKVPRQAVPATRECYLKTDHTVSKGQGSRCHLGIRLGLSRRRSAGKPLHSIVRVESR